MSNYTKSTNFATKDNLPTGDPLKIVKGTEIDTEFNNIATAVSTKTDNASAAITGGSITGITDLAIADGGTGASTATAAINNLLPSQTSNANKYLQTDGTNVSWDAISINTGDITGTLPVANGGTGVTSSTGTGSVVLSNSPTLVTPSLGAATASTLDVSGNVTLSGGTANTIPYLNGSKVVTTGTELYFNGTNLGVGTSASYRVDLGSATSDDAAVGIRIGRGGSSTTWSLIDNVGGSGNYRQYSSGTPTLRWLTSTNGTSWSEQMRLNATGLGVGNNNPTEKLDVTGSALVSGSVTASQFYGSFNGAIGNTTAYSGAFTSLTTSSTVTINGGTANGIGYLNGSKVFTTGTVLKFDGLNFISDRSTSTVYSGTNQATWANGIVLNNSSTPATGIFDSIYFSNNANMINVFGVAQNASGYGDFVWAGYAGTYTEWMKLTSSGLTLTSNPTLSGGTANGVTYLNGSKVLTSGSALTFDGTLLTQTVADASTSTKWSGATGKVRLRPYTDSTNGAIFDATNSAESAYVPLSLFASNINYSADTASIWKIAGSEQMRLTSTGLGIGTSTTTNGTKLTVAGAIAATSGITAHSASKLVIDQPNTTTSYIRSYGPNTTTAGTTQFIQASSDYSVAVSSIAIDGSGNVGIGTSSPSFKLQVEGAANSAALTLLRLNNSGTTSGGPGIASRISFTAGATALGYIQGSNFASGAGGLQFSGDGTNAQATLDNAGNLGLGVTPSAWGSDKRVLQFDNGASIYANKSVPAVYLGSNFYENSSGSPTYSTSTFASQYYQYNGQHVWRTAASGTAGNAISFTQAMTLDANANLQLNTTTNKVTQFGGSATGMTIGSATYPVLSLWDTADASYNFCLAQDGGTAYLYNNANGPMLFYTNATERARIDSSGAFTVGSTSVVASGFAGVKFNGASYNGFGLNDSSATSGAGYIYFQSNGTTIGSITRVAATSAVAYNTTSDQRLKQNISDSDSASSLIDAIKVRKYNWKSDGSYQPYGFIAQELVTVVPEAVHQPSDPQEMMGVDYSKLVPMLVKEIQSLRQRVAQLESN